jgi:hypothetical protein
MFTFVQHKTKTTNQMEEQIANFTQNLKYIGASPDDFYTISFWNMSETPTTCMCRKTNFDINKIVYPYQFSKSTTKFHELYFEHFDILIVLT